MQELPLLLRRLSIEGSRLVESALEAMTHTQPTCLQYLTIENCDSVVSLTSFNSDAFPNLRSLTISGCSNMKSVVVSESRALSSLDLLWICGCRSLESLATLVMGATQLKILIIDDCPEIEWFGEGGLPPNLTWLVIIRSKKLVGWVASIDLHTHALTNLVIDGEYCESVKSFPHRLTSLRINGPWESVKWFPKQGCLPLPPSLQSLSLYDLESVKTLDCNGLLHLTSLPYLTIHGCPKLENLTGDRLPASLTTLCISSCPLLG